MGRDRSVGIATRYELEGPGIESRWGAKFSSSFRTGPGPHPSSYIMGTGSFSGVKRPGRGVVHPPLSIAEVKERIELYVYSNSGPSCACSRVNFNLTELSVNELIFSVKCLTYFTDTVSACGDTILPDGPDIICISRSPE